MSRETPEQPSPELLEDNLLWGKSLWEYHFRAISIARSGQDQTNALRQDFKVPQESKV
jgi:hypothetical protein